MRKALKIIFYVVLIAIILAVTSTITIYVKYKNVKNSNIPAEYIKAAVNPESGKVPLGEAVKVTYTIKTPWDKKPIKLSIEPGKGSQAVGMPCFIKIKTGWGYDIWTVECAVQPFVNGEIPEGNVKLVISHDLNGKMADLKLKFPKIFSEEIPVSKDKLNLASTVNEKQTILKSNKIYYLIAGIIVVIILLALYFIFIRKRKEKPVILTSWAEALIELNKLKENVRGKVFNSGHSMSFLTDIVRHYLEARFEIHAPKQTTQEFLKDMESWKSPLNNKDRNFLRDFMMTADMIKFAKLNVSEKQIIDAIDRAEELVKETTPEAIEESNKETESKETV